MNGTELYTKGFQVVIWFCIIMIFLSSIVKMMNSFYTAMKISEKMNDSNIPIEKVSDSDSPEVKKIKKELKKSSYGCFFY
jgi:hypothetical protein